MINSEYGVNEPRASAIFKTSVNVSKILLSRNLHKDSDSDLGTRTRDSETKVSDSAEVDSTTALD